MCIVFFPVTCQYVMVGWFLDTVFFTFFEHIIIITSNFIVLFQWAVVMVLWISPSSSRFCLLYFVINLY